MHPEEDSPLLTEARASVTWGDDAHTVISLLTAQGMPEAEATALVRTLQAERTREVRARNRRRLIIGLALCTLCAVFFIILPWREWRDALNSLVPSRRSKPGNWLLCGAVSATVCGIWFTWRGFWGLLIPAQEELTDVE